MRTNRICGILYWPVHFHLIAVLLVSLSCSNCQSVEIAVNFVVFGFFLTLKYLSF